MVLLSIDAFSFSYLGKRHAVPALENVSLSIKSGQAIAVIGASGSGKTTLALSPFGLIPTHLGVCTQGSVSIDGVDTKKYSRKLWRSVRNETLGFIFQESISLNPLLVVIDPIMEVFRFVGKQSKTQARLNAYRMLESVGISDVDRVARAYPHELSGGMRQQIMVACALAGNPDLIVADEPTSSLSQTASTQVLDLLQRSRLGRALWLITHDISAVARSCDYVYVLSSGRIVEQGPVDRVLGSPQHECTVELFGTLTPMTTKLEMAKEGSWDLERRRTARVTI